MNSAFFKLPGEASGWARLFSSITFCCALLLAGAAQEAKAAFIGYYALDNFTLTNTGGLTPNGYASSPDSGTLVLTGTNDGSGVPGLTELTIAVPNSGLFQFDYTFATGDDPTYEYAGYVLSGELRQLADTDGENGSVVVPVLSAEIIGFYAGSVDDTGGAGVLTVPAFR